MYTSYDDVLQAKRILQIGEFILLIEAIIYFYLKECYLEEIKAIGTLWRIQLHIQLNHTASWLTIVQECVIMRIVTEGGVTN